MSLWGVTLDKWAVGKESTIVATITIQSICLFISLGILTIRGYSMYNNWDILKAKRKISILQWSQWLMCLISCFYLFLHEWNYVHLITHFPNNRMDCAAWFSLIMIAIPSTRVFLFVFLMLRSTFTFEGTVCEINKKYSYFMIIITIIGNYIIPLPLILSDFTPVSPFPDKGFCFRVLGPNSVIGLNIMHGSNCVASFVALVIFYWKARTVKKLFMSYESDGKMSSSLMELNYKFVKHTRLGMITVAGTIVIFFFGDMLSVLVGITFALDQTTNNFLTFIMFQESEKYYKCILCKRKETQSQENVIQMAKSAKKDGVEETDTNTNGSGTNGDTVIAVIH